MKRVMTVKRMTDAELKIVEEAFRPWDSDFIPDGMEKTVNLYTEAGHKLLRELKAYRALVGPTPSHLTDFEFEEQVRHALAEIRKLVTA